MKMKTGNETLMEMKDTPKPRTREKKCTRRAEEGNLHIRDKDDSFSFATVLLFQRIMCPSEYTKS